MKQKQININNIIDAILENKKGFLQVIDCIEQNVYFIISKNEKIRNALFVGTFKNKNYADTGIYNFTIFENLFAIPENIEPISFSFDTNDFIFAKYTSIYSKATY